jgi:hypothetical protein
MFLLSFLIKDHTVMLLYYCSLMLLKKGYKEVSKWREEEEKT